MRDILTSWRAPALSVLMFLLFIGAWHAATLPVVAQQTVDAEYAKLVGSAAATGQKSSFPTPADVGAKIWQHLQEPFYDRGPNDKGVGIQLAYSLARVLSGFML
ncbi:MAG: nitrate ABC transporter, permease protein, partial [Burkholderiales bacterium]|nr:nitrate ABC transporter, permease protein [Burkholderiales bacterium]